MQISSDLPLWTRQALVEEYKTLAFASKLYTDLRKLDEAYEQFSVSEELQGCVVNRMKTKFYERFNNIIKDPVYWNGNWYEVKQLIETLLLFLTSIRSFHDQMITKNGPRFQKFYDIIAHKGGCLWAVYNTFDNYLKVLKERANVLETHDLEYVE